jgi:hypothetical protein
MVRLRPRQASRTSAPGSWADSGDAAQEILSPGKTPRRIVHPNGAGSRERTAHRRVVIDDEHHASASVMAPGATAGPRELNHDHQNRPPSSATTGTKRRRFGRKSTSIRSVKPSARPRDHHRCLAHDATERAGPIGTEACQGPVRRVRSSSKMAIRKWRDTRHRDKDGLTERISDSTCSRHPRESPKEQPTAGRGIEAPHS